MSDPVTNVEIEDVLSSIRRLVSADDRGQAQRHDEQQPTRQQREAKLVLTPAQRVDEQDEDDLSAQMEIDAPDEDEPDDSRFDGIEDAEIVEARSGDDETDADILKDLPQFIRRGMHERVEEPAPAPEHDEQPEAGEAALDEFDADVAAEDAPYDDWDDLEEDAALLSDDVEEGSDPDLEGPEVADPDESGLDDEDAETGEIDLKALEARIAGFETAVAEQDEDWEPDGSSDDDYAAGPQSPLPWQDVEEDEADEGQQTEAYDPEVEPAPDAYLDEDVFEDAPAASAAPDSLEREDAPGRADAEGGTWYSDDAVLDEDALRDMVSEIVRQELQGALGERITRNVRKLVRREIHRALMSQGID